VTNSGDGRNHALATLALCFLVAMLEGHNLQSTGIAASRMGASLHISKSALGEVFSIGSLGLLPGAMLGGRFADRWGRKKVLLMATLLFGLFSLLTARVENTAMLMLARFMTGAGLGAALPNLIALATEAVEPGHRSRAVAFMYAGVPLGGVMAALTSNAVTGAEGWRSIFLVGGAVSLVLLLPIALFMPESRAYLRDRGEHRVSSAPIMQVLFGEGRANITIALWVSYFFTLAVVYLLLNWLPSLLEERGLARPQAGVVQIMFNIGAAVGSLAFGWLLDQGARRLSVILMYAGVVASLLALAVPWSFDGLRVAGFAGGLFVVGGQLVLYALAPMFYASAMRGTGVGSAVAAGRLGAVAGPLVAGVILSAGWSGDMVLFAAIPGIVVAGSAAITLGTGRRC